MRENRKARNPRRTHKHTLSSFDEEKNRSRVAKAFLIHQIGNMPRHALSLRKNRSGHNAQHAVFQTPDTRRVWRFSWA